MGVLKVGGAVAALLAIVVGIVAKVCPEVVLKIPNIGFIAYAILGGNSGFVPPYFDNEQYKIDNFRDWARDGDVMVAVGAKSGTTWMCYCSDAIRRKGSDEVGLPYTDIMYSTPWLEMRQYPGQPWSERKDLYNTTVLPNGKKLKDYWDNPAFPFRVFKTHFGPKQAGGSPYADILPIKEFPKVKYVAVVRNPYEMFGSWYSFVAKHRDQFRQAWGGFPPEYPDLDSAAKDVLPGGNSESLYFPYVKSWWAFRNEPNVLLMHYTDMVNDLDGMVRKLSAFLGVDLSPGQAEAVKTKCSFQHMKENSNQFDYILPLNLEMGTVIKASQFVNQGKSDGGTGAKSGLSAETTHLIEEALATELKDPALRRWAVSGGPFQ